MRKKQRILQCLLYAERKDLGHINAKGASLTDIIAMQIGEKPKVISKANTTANSERFKKEITRAKYIIRGRFFFSQAFFHLDDYREGA